MKFIKENSGAILFYLLITITCLALAYSNKIENKKMSANDSLETHLAD